MYGLHAHARTGVPIFVAALCASMLALAEPKAISVSDAWARATPPSAANGAAYLTITNTGATDDTLLSITTPAASMAMLHTTRNEGGVMRMDAADTMPIKAGGAIVMKPGGTHIMLMSLGSPLKPGNDLHLTLTFKKAGAIDVAVPVRTSAPEVKR